MLDSPTDCGTHESGTPALLSMAQVRELSATNGLRVIGLLALDYLVILVVVALCVHFKSYFAYAIALPVLGGRYVALGIAMHDAVHYRLFKNRRVNDFVGSVLVGAPILMSMRDYRAVHLDHHRYLGSDRDPELPMRKAFASPRDRRALVVFSLLGIAGVSFMATMNRAWRRWASLAVLPAVAVLDWAVPSVGRPLIFCWLVPIFVWAHGANILRAYWEHFPVVSQAPLSAEERAYTARNVIVSWVKHHLVMPHNIGYHLDHHLFPSVPMFRLPDLHRALSLNPRHRPHDFVTFREAVADQTARLAAQAAASNAPV
jgi:fatty acid desaturase